MSFGSLCGSRSYATVKVDAVHAFLLRNRSFLSAHSKAGGEGGEGREGKLDKRGVVLVGTILRKKAGACCAPGWIIRLEHSNRSFILFLSKMFSLLSCTSTRHGIRHMTD